MINNYCSSTNTKPVRLVLNDTKYPRRCEEHWPTDAARPARPAKKATAAPKYAGMIGHALFNVVVDQIDRAKKIVNFSCSDLTAQEVAIALINAHKRPGVKVSGSVNREKAWLKVSLVGLLLKHGIDIRLNDNETGELFVIDSNVLSPANDWSGRVQELGRNMGRLPLLNMPGEPSLTTRLGGYLDETALLPLIVDMDNTKRSVVIGARVLKNKEVADAMIRAKAKFDRQASVLFDPKSADVEGSQIPRLVAAGVLVEPMPMVVMTTLCYIDGVVLLDGTNDWMGHMTVDDVARGIAGLRVKEQPGNQAKSVSVPHAG